MRYRSAVLLAAAALGVLGVLHAQRPFKQYPSSEYGRIFRFLPTGTRKPSGPAHGFTIPASTANPAGDSTSTGPSIIRARTVICSQGVRRLTRIETRSVEQIVDLDGTDDVYNWPMMYAVEVGHWDLPDKQAAQLREFLLRGGFLMVDDFHGDEPYHNVIQ